MECVLFASLPLSFSLSLQWDRALIELIGNFVFDRRFFLFILIFSIKEYVENCDDYVVSLVDGMLDTLTKGQHSKTMALLKQVRETIH